MTATEIRIVWESQRDGVRDAARFLARVVRLDTAYISHGEIQQALSPDGIHWASDLEDRFLDAAADMDDSRSVLTARAGTTILGAAIVHWSLDSEARFATLEDIAVEPGGRSTGVGQQMFEVIEAEARRRGAHWVFLESGLHNERAHGFFERAGFHPVSKVFSKRLG